MSSASPPRVSVIIVSYNKKELLGETLAGLRRQSFRDFEIIVVDNASTDGSAEFVAATFPDARLIVSNENTGFAKGNNIGIESARGEFIAFLNNDAVPEKTWLSELLDAAARHPEAGFFASRVLRQEDPTRLDTAGDGITFAGTAYRRGHLQPAMDYAREEFIFGASGSAAFYRRSVLEEIGLFDEDFFAVYEDVDLSFRAQLAGYKCRYVPTAIVYHRGSSTIGKFSEFYVYQTQRNVEFFFFKDIPALLLAFLLPQHLLYDLFGWLYFTFRQHRGGAFWRAKGDALKSMPRILRKRKIIQAKRKVELRYLISLMSSGWIFRTVKEKLG